MFETDDFDQVLSQFEFPEDISTKVQGDLTDKVKCVSPSTFKPPSPAPTIESSKSFIEGTLENVILPNKTDAIACKRNVENVVSPKHAKRKIINSHFDKNTKRKFPGPAGLLTGNLDEAKDENIGQMELLSQDIDFTENHLCSDVFQSPLWVRLTQDITKWTLNDVDQIKMIKQRAVAGHLPCRKAQTVMAFVENVDRSAIDPLIILRDTTGNIKCTLHRDAWSTFSPYIVSEFCALVLLKPTVLTTGSAFKKHYLNITLSNIYAVYSTAILEDDGNTLPDCYTKHCDENFTVIRTKENAKSFGTSFREIESGANDLDDLDNIFSEDLF